MSAVVDVPLAGAERDGRASMEDIHRILVCRTSHSLGSTLLTTPLLRELEGWFPGAEVDIVCRNAVSPEIFGHFATVRSVHVLPRRVARRPARFLAEFSRLRQIRYDLVIDTSRSSESDRLILLWANGRYKIGFAQKYGAHALSSRIDVPNNITHVGQLPVFLLRRAIAVDASALSYPIPNVQLSAAERARGLLILDRVLSRTPRAAGGKVIGIFANATGKKQYSQAWWARFVRAIELRYPDHAFVELIPFDAVSRLNDRYPTFYTTDIRKLASVIANLSLFISPDCGVMHLACAAQATTVGLFSVTKPSEWAPYGPSNSFVNTLGESPEWTTEQISLRYPLPI